MIATTGEPSPNDLKSLKAEAMAIFHRYAEDQQSLQRISLSEEAQRNLGSFLALNLRDLPENYVVELLLSTGKYWNSLGLDFWHSILELVGEREIGTLTLVLFLRKWLRVEIMPFVTASKRVAPRVKEFTQLYGKRRQGDEELNWMDQRLLSDLKIESGMLETWRRSIKRVSESGS
jgi:hypothetical protein